MCVQEQGSKAGVCETEQCVLSLSVSSACAVCFIYVDQSLKALSNSSISPTSVCVCVQLQPLAFEPCHFPLDIQRRHEKND